MSNIFSVFKSGFDTWHKVQNVPFSKNGPFENESSGLQAKIQKHSITPLHSSSSVGQMTYLARCELEEQ